MKRTQLLAGVAASLCLLPPLTRRWDDWLQSHHEHDEEYLRKDGKGTLKLASSRPTRAAQIARGVLSCFAFLAAADVLVARKMRDDTSRYFLLHTLANAVITLSSFDDMRKVLTDPINEALGRVNILPTYMIPCLFSYHLTCFKNVPAEEWQHHLIFGLGLSGPQLRYCAGPIQNAVGFFMCGLPGGIDYAMLAAVKEGLLTSKTEKVWNSRIQVWCRSPGILLAAYAIYLCSRYAPVHGPPKVLPLLAFALASFNGQYYMQKVVANTSLKCDGQGAC